ncbi:MAG: ATP-binding domain-containing protein [Lachnospiraceae bacterium]|nr:ATP-binding domain-containing protein [Lachnospiraceae bacterium]
MKVKDIVRLILKDIRFLQGSTYENVFVDVNDIVFDREGKIYPDIEDMLRRLYVACSRTRKDLIICYGR